ncbi:hypothetical protein PNOK_0096600 [Pyrrhoderma noxium]|uniref:Uncharacterized protein n=1 Tax=Pyrrhoderma noxium TaxID=2282107 RepID=A0A286UWE4_9AGAM|nr:hypothetical protein PNOK_0096600 [Pyrrhoderma noxium]
MDSLAVAIQGDERISVKESSSQYSVRSKDDDYSVYGLPSDAHDMKSLYEFLGVSTPFDPRAQFTTSPFLSPGLLAACRLLIAFYILFTLIFVLVWDAVRLHSANSYFSYFTELSNIGLCSYFFASGVQTFVYARSGGRSYPLERWPKFLQFLHILLFSTITTFPILVTIVYWGELYPQSPFSDAFGAWENVSLHALNTVFAFFEITTTNAGPTPYNHCIFIVLLLACYLGVAYITHATQGFYTYGFLNPSNKSSGVLVAWIIGIGVAGVKINGRGKRPCGGA